MGQYQSVSQKQIHGIPHRRKNCQGPKPLAVRVFVRLDARFCNSPLQICATRQYAPTPPSMRYTSRTPGVTFVIVPNSNTASTCQPASPLSETSQAARPSNVSCIGLLRLEHLARQFNSSFFRPSFATADISCQIETKEREYRDEQGCYMPARFLDTVS